MSAGLMGVASVLNNTVFAGNEGEMECVCNLLISARISMAYRIGNRRENIRGLAVFRVYECFSLCVTVWSGFVSPCN